MAKTLTVHTLYGDDEALQIVLKRLIEHSYAFHYTGEFLYDNRPWDKFIDHHCQDIKDRLHAYTEHWADTTLSFESTGSAPAFVFYEDGKRPLKVNVEPVNLSLACSLFHKLCELAVSQGIKVQYVSHK